MTVFDAKAALSIAPVVPVIVIEDADLALPLGEALLRGGLRTAEITLRSDAALAAIKTLATQLPELVTGAGTVLSASQLRAAADAGARYALSPGYTDELLVAGRASEIPFIPGIATPSEAMRAASFGYTCFKLFPAQALSGVNMLGAMSGPLPFARFCPTGGITLSTARDYLELRNVLCVGGSWIVPPRSLVERDWAFIETQAREAMTLKGVLN